MSIKKVGQSKWLIRVTMLDEVKGYPVCKQETINGNQADAKAREVELLRELKGRSLTTAKSINTFSEAIDLYVTRLNALGRTSRSHCSLVAEVRNNFGHLPLSAVADRFTEWLKYYANTVAPKTGRMRRGASINRHISAVKAVFGVLVALELIDKNPITAARFPKHKESPRDRYLDDHERLRLFGSIKECFPEMLPIILYMFLVPCRVGELMMAKREQYNSFTGTIYIPDSKAGIPIHKPVPEEMREYFNSIPENCPWLFYWTDKKGNYRPWLTIRKPWQHCLKKAGFSNLRIHDLRHIAVTDLHAAGNSDRAIAKIAGWKSPAMMTTYWHYDGLRDAQKIEFKQGTNVIPFVKGENYYQTTILRSN